MKWLHDFEKCSRILVGRANGEDVVVCDFAVVIVAVTCLQVGSLFPCSACLIIYIMYT